MVYGPPVIGRRRGRVTAEAVSIVRVDGDHVARFGNPAQDAPGGPLAGLTPTQANTGPTGPAGADSRWPCIG
jgi:hypothetical protein